MKYLVFQHKIRYDKKWLSYTFSGPPYEDKGVIEEADVKEVLMADEDIAPQEFVAYNEHEINNVAEQTEENIDRVDEYEDVFGYSYFNSFPNFNSFKIN